MREIDRGGLRAPARVLDIDVRRDYGDEVVDVADYATAWCLIRDGGAVVGAAFLDLEDDPTLALADLSAHFAAAGLPQPVDRREPPTSTLTVVICTRDRSAGLRNMLSSLSAQSDPDFEVLVVDNSRDGDLARSLVSFENLAIRSCHEPAPGLSRARNRGLAEVHTDLIGWLDDDELADRDWVYWIKQGFAAPGSPDAVAGVMLPAELETGAQVDFERYGGFNKGRGMEPIRLLAGTPAVPDPLYPLPSFGAGGNMAFRTAALRSIGGFDNRLGAGTLTHGGEETRAFSLLLDRGSLVLHWPPAVTWHYHRRTYEELEKQFYGYSAGLTAFFMSFALSSPTSILRIAAFLPRGVKRILANTGSGHVDGPPPGFPDHLLRAGRKGLYQGAGNYLKEVRRQRRAALPAGGAT